jgi:hypothetical protein
MSLSTKPDSTQKAWQQPPSAAPTKVKTVGWLLVGTFAVFVITGIIPQLQWMFSGLTNAGSQWAWDLLGNHIYWIDILFVLLGGYGLLTQKGYGYLLARSACIFWVGSRLLQHIYLLLFAHIGVLRSATAILGLNMPPNMTTLGILFINVVSVYALVTLGKPSIKAGLGLRPQLERQSLLLGGGMLVYGVICFVLKELLMPRLDFVYFEF